MTGEGLDPDETFVAPLYHLKNNSEEGKRECKIQMALVKLKMSQNKTESLTKEWVVSTGGTRN